MDTAKKAAWVFFAAGAKPTSMRKAIAERIAESDPVIIVEESVSVARQRAFPGLADRVRALRTGTGSCSFQPIHLPVRIPGLEKQLRRLNQRRMRRELDQILPLSEKRIVCYDSPTQDELVGQLGENISLYFAVDDRTRTVSGKPIRGEADAERRLLARVNMVVCVSEFLARALRTRLPANARIPIDVLPNGYDEKIFRPDIVAAEPSLLASIPRPRLLVAGLLSDRLDWDGIVSAARLRPHWTWVFVGPAEHGTPAKLTRLNKEINKRCNESSIARLVWLGLRDVHEIPALISHSDVCAVPYRLNPFTLASSPLKGIEYLAMGAPVLGTRIPDLLRYGECIEWVAEGSGESYAQALDRLFARKDDPEWKLRRIGAVRDDTLSAKAVAFRNAVLDAGH